MGKFTIKANDAGFTFDLKAANGQVIATSQLYKSKEACKGGIESVRTNCAAAVEDQTIEGYEEIAHPKYEVYTDKAGEFRFRLKAANGETIAASEGYTAKQSCLGGIASIGENAPDAEVVEE